MWNPSITREPGSPAASLKVRIPEAGRFGNVSPGGISSATVLSALPHNAPCPTIYRNFPSGAHITLQTPAQIGPGGLPFIGTAIEAVPLPSCLGVIAAIQRRSGEMV